VAVAYYEANASGGSGLSRYIQRALAAADTMKHKSWQLKVRKLLVNTEDLAYLGFLDVENMRIEPCDPLALADWPGGSNWSSILN